MIRTTTQTQLFLKLIVALLVLSGVWWALTVQAQADPPIHPDGWDLSFGGDGEVNTGCGTWTIGVWAGSFHVQPDDKILLFANCNEQATLLRFLPNGAPDSSFGVNGRATISHTLGTWGAPTTQSDGGIIVTGANLVVRYQPDGVLDPTFGLNGAVASPLDPEQLLVQMDDKIVVRNGNDIARFTKQGVLDTTFNGVGSLSIENILPKPNKDATQLMLDVAVQPDGNLLLAVDTLWRATSFDPQQERIEIVHLTSTGALDQSFATAGIYTVVTTAPIYDHSCHAYLALQPDGSILAVNPDTHQLIRLSATGELDPTFQTPSLCFDHILIDSLGYILGSAGYWTNRLLPTGALDTSWGHNGQLEKTGPNWIDFQQDGSLIIGNTVSLARNVRSKEHPAPATATPTPEPSPTPTATPLPPEQRPLALIYAVLDNNLGEQWTRLVNNVEAGAQPNMDVRLLVDGPGTDDSYVYDIGQDLNPFCPTIEDPTCHGRYQIGQNYHKFFTEDAARPHALYQFVLDSLLAHPKAPRVVLSIIGHGSGWSANVLPGQPSKWRAQEDTIGGMLWDDHPGNGQAESRSMSTMALNQALQWATEETGKRLDLLYLDGCGMGMSEVAYEVRNSADFLLASPNVDWASFTYNKLLPALLPAQDGQAIGRQWLQVEAAEFRANPGHPFTLALTDLTKMQAVATATTGLADTLQALLPSQKTQITAAFMAADHFDSDFDGDLDQQDAYVDFPALITQLRTVLPTETSLISATQVISTALASVIVTKDHQDGVPWVYADQTWHWPNFGGLSIYAPISQDETRRRLFYNQHNLAWAQDTTWDEFLAAYWGTGVAVHGATATLDMPVCHATTQGCQGLAKPLTTPIGEPRLLYLSEIMR